jgi:DNA-binding NtrC family response regulator
MARILVLEDDSSARFVMAEMLVRSGHEARGAGKPEDAIEGVAMADFEPEVLVADWMLKSDLTGLDVAEKLQARYPNLRVVFITALPTEKLREDAKARGIKTFKFVRKPCEFFDLLDAIHQVL